MSAEPVKQMFAMTKSALAAANEKLEASYMYSHSNAISVFGLMYRPTSYFVEKRHFATNHMP